MIDTSNPVHQFSLGIDGMSCASCVARVEKALQAIPGVAKASVNLGTETASVEANDSVNFAALQQVIEKAGYGVAQEEFVLAVEGMSCASCVGRVEKALRKIDGVSAAGVNLATESARVRAAKGVGVYTLLKAV